MVDRKTAQNLEKIFFQRVERNVLSFRWVFNPLDGKFYDASSKNVGVRIVEPQQNVIDIIKSSATGDFQKIYEEMPKNQILVYEVSSQPFLGQRTVKLSFVAASVSPLEELAKSGVSETKAGVNELQGIKNVINMSEDVFYYIGVFSTTGWSEETRSHLIGKTHLTALIDFTYGFWRSIYAPDPRRWHEAKVVFDLSTNKEKFEAIKAFVEAHRYELITDRLTVDFASERLSLDKAVIIQAFKAIEAYNQFIKFDDSSYPPKLIRAD